MTRRDVLGGLLGLGGLVVGLRYLFLARGASQLAGVAAREGPEGAGTPEGAGEFGKLELSPQRWRDVLVGPAYAVLREEATERSGSSPLDHEKRAGTFVCAGCFLPLFPSSFKYDSGTGWPSFFDVIAGRVGTSTDYKLVLPRTEYHCARCGGHQGHVFDDGPEPTGLRYCNNGIALSFVPEGEELPALRQA